MSVVVVVLCFDVLGFRLGISVVDMGCSVSKEDDLPLVIRCRERKQLIKAAADNRYILAAAHVSYFRSMKDVGEALRRFVDEELLVPSPSASASPVLTLPSDEIKLKSKKNHKNKHTSNKKNPSSSPSISHSGSVFRHDENVEDSHLDLSSGYGSELGSESGHIHIHDSPEVEGNSFSSPPTQTDWAPYGATSPPQTGWGPYVVNSNSYPYPYSNVYYMKRSEPAIESVIYEEPNTSYMYSKSFTSNPYENVGFFGFPMGSAPPPSQPNDSRRPSPPAVPPPPPPPEASAWDFFLNPFDSYDNGYHGYPGYYSQSRYGYGSIASSPDSNEVREREGIPDLEDETENEGVDREVYKGKKVNQDTKRSAFEGTSKAMPSQNREGSFRTMPTDSSEGSIRTMPPQKGEKTSRAIPSPNSETAQSANLNEEKSHFNSVVSKSSDDGSMRKKGVSFEVDEDLVHGVESSKSSSLTTLSVHGTRDLQEVVMEIRDEFEVASSYGKEVALMLEVEKLPYQPKYSVLKVLLSRILYLIAPSLPSSRPASRRSVRLAFSTMKLAKSYYGDSGEDIYMKPSNISSTLEKLYMWEKKLYKEVKEEERLRVIYENTCKRLKVLDDQGAEISKIDATQTSLRKLLTKLDVCIKAVDAISSRIHKLRDEELQPQVNELIHGLIRMWKCMLKCHQKQFQAIMDSKALSLRAKAGLRRDSSLRATLELEVELLTWCSRFKDWINTQKSFIESLNGWLFRCLLYEPEETPDGVIPFSPGRIGAPPVFLIANDWVQAMETVSEMGVEKSVHSFASSLQKLLEKQNVEQNRRLKAEYISKDSERRLRTLRMERERTVQDQDSIVLSESGVSSMDDLKVDLDSMRKRLDEEREVYKEAVKLVRREASSSLQAGLVPIFEALGNYSSEALKAYEQVRIESA